MHTLGSFGIFPWDWTQRVWPRCPGVPCTDVMGHWLSQRHAVSLIRNTKGHFSGSMGVMLVGDETGATPSFGVISLGSLVCTLFMMVFWIAMFNDKCKAGLRRRTRTKQCGLSLRRHVRLNKSSTWPSKIVLLSANNTEGEWVDYWRYSIQEHMKVLEKKGIWCKEKSDVKCSRCRIMNVPTGKFHILSECKH